jgi:hypothetical protein
MPPQSLHSSEDHGRPPIAAAHLGGRSNWPGKAHGKVGGLDQLLRQRVVQPRPFGPHVRQRQTVQQILQLERIGCEIVFDAAVDAKINRVSSVPLTQRAQVGAGCAG